MAKVFELIKIKCLKQRNLDLEKGALALVGMVTKGIEVV